MTTSQQALAILLTGLCPAGALAVEPQTPAAPKLPGALTAYTITTLTNGKEYHFEVIATNEKGKSKPSNAMSAVPTP